MELIDFDKDFFNKLEGKEKVLIKPEGHYHCIKIGREKIGVVGFIPGNKGAGFIQIIISPSSRGKGYTKLAEDLLAKNYDLKWLWATIDNDNIASIRAHLRTGFKMLSDEEIKKLQLKGFLGKNKTRMFKNYS